MPDEKKLMFKNYIKNGLTIKEASEKVNELNNKLKESGKKICNTKKTQNKVINKLNKKFLKSLERVTKKKE